MSVHATISLPISGLTCASCAQRAEQALMSVAGIDGASVNLASERAEIETGEAMRLDEAVAALAKAGFGVPAERIDLDITGMSCAACVTRVETALKSVPGVIDARVNLADGHAAVDVAAIAGAAGAQADAAALIAAVAATGYGAGVRKDMPEPDAELRRLKAERRQLAELVLALLLTGPLIAPMLAEPFGAHGHLPGWWQLALAFVVQAMLGRRFYVGAWKALRQRTGTMDTLVALGGTAAWGLSAWHVVAGGGPLYFEAGAAVVSFVLLGKWLEARARRGTSAAVRALMRLRPQSARVLRGGKPVEVPVAELRRGEVVLIRPGERVPVDGVVVDGESDLDEALLTGEPLPVHKEAGAHVTGGSVNGDGALQVRAETVGRDTVLARIIALVDGAQASKPPVQRQVDRVAAIFVPVVLAIAAATLLGWLLAGYPADTAILNAVSVLVIACPCALGLATPAALMVGIGAGARGGILIRDAEVLERARRVDTIVFDKTGTLTEGRPRLRGIWSAPVGSRQGDDNRLLRLVASAQQGSEHPLAAACLAAAEARALTVLPVRGFARIAGRGFAAVVEGRELRVGNARLMDEIHVAADAANVPAEAADETRVWVAEAVGPGRFALLGALTFGDTIRPESAAAIAELKQQGIVTVLLSGDTKHAAAAVAATLGIDRAIAEVLPEDKERIVAELTTAGHVVAMVGDGVNDAPALAAADLGIAVGGGADVAAEAAGLILMRPDPRLVAVALALSRATLSVLRQNLFFAFVYNTIGLPLAALGLLNPVFAGAAMALSSLSVVGNALRLARWKPAGIVARSKP